MAKQDPILYEWVQNNILIGSSECSCSSWCNYSCSLNNFWNHVLEEITSRGSSKENEREA